ncbi:hypothetical protein [uncultured Microbacterium sp.]|uniref:hypothetical protein n=1 Tax=uncultured Microbacterium sp. TaxID=191216 RepID=UPI00259186E6|nr:hypothetical protein [uncultured Microbacterium sp.]
MAKKASSFKVPKDNASLAALFDMDFFPSEGAAIGGRCEILDTARRIVENSKIEKMLHAWRAEDRGDKRPGPTPWLSEVQVTTLMIVLTLSRRAPLFTEMRDLLRHTPAETLTTIGIDMPDEISDDALYHRAYNTYQRLIEVMNPEPGSLYWLMTKDETSAWAARHRDKKHTVRRARAYAFGNALLHGTWMLLPRGVRRSYRGDVAFDATVVAAPARGRGKRSLYASSDPGAGWYRRDGDHDGGSTARADTKYSRTTSELLWGREAHTAISYGANIPVIVLAMTLDVPGKRLAENALTCIDALHNHGLPVGHFVADRAYLPGTKAEDLALPLRARDYRIVFDYTRDHLGQQASHAGALLIEGRWYSPGIPTPLRDASIDYFLRQDDDPQRISTSTYEQRIEQRKAYELHRKERADDEGYQRLQCPAVGPSATIKCPYRDSHPKTVDRPLTRLLPVLLPKPRPQVCDQQTITVPPSAGAKYEQEYPYQSERWAEQYTSGRQSVESMNNSLKHGAHLPIDDPQKRPRRGWIAQLISLVTMVVATNTRKIIAWLIDQIGVSSISTAPVERTRRRDLTHGWTTAPANAPPETAATA